ncbi:MAG: Helix-turn-helix domain [Acidobacteriota bacterium]|jgi:tetratricopeptide (TPR) repeat protein|nr:Helix-turn-helix domain [Acidobacteriota bacterium]
MDDHRDSRDEKETLGQTATALRRSKNLSQDEIAKELGVRRARVSEIETGKAATAELVQELAERIGYHRLHVVKTMHLIEFLGEEQRRPFDPIGPTPEQEVDLYKACQALGAELDAMYRGRIRRENLEHALKAAAGKWEKLKSLALSRRRAEIRRNPDFHTWSVCLFLCAESVRWATDQPKTAPHVGRLAVVVARRCAEPWVERLVAYALAHLANAYRVLGKHREAELLFGKAGRLWSSPGAAAADPGVLDPGRIFDLEASLRKDQRKLPEALALLDRAFPISRVPGRILVSRSLVLSLMGFYEEAITTLQRAAEFLVDPEPRDKAVLDYNMGVNYCHLNRFDEAATLADSAFKLLEASKSRIDILRCRWLRARVLDGQGDHLTALSTYRNLVSEFHELDMKYDLALVTLELAALLLSLGQIWECRSLTAGLPAYFEAKKIYPEALAALKVFSDSVQLETATEALARQAAAFLYLSRGNPGLRFVPASL